MGASASVHHAVSKTQFGDGYAQRVSLGINNQRTDWSGSKTGDWQTVILPIKTFLDEHKGVIPFLWTNPHGQTKKYVCENYEISQKKGNFWEISLKFEQSNSDSSSVPLLDFSNQNSGTSTPNLPQSALDDINKKIQDEIERSTQKDDAHDKAIQSLNTSKTSLSKSIDEIKEQLAGVSSVPMSVAWDSITGKPSSFNPSSHSHTISDISGLQSLLNAKANSNHSHSWNSITDKPQSFTPSSHTHQASDITDLHTILSKYATKDEIPRINTDGLTIDTSNLATKSSVNELSEQIATKADLSHTHTMSEVTDLSAELERYALK
ncbi:phage tail protein, partial [Moraxella catarrhalis]|uniref:phage tail protein n=1 Tax=Moraxella catarrhalis TaxID=480 RepID=UPI0022288518